MDQQFGNKPAENKESETLAVDFWRLVRDGKATITNDYEIIYKDTRRRLGRVEHLTGHFFAIEVRRVDVERLWPTADPQRWGGVLPLAEAVQRLWPNLAEQINNYTRSVGRLHLRKPTPGAPGGERVLIEVDVICERVAAPDDVQHRWVDITDVPGIKNIDAKTLLPPYEPYEVPQPHPGEEFLGRLRELTKGESPYELVFRRLNDFGARWQAVALDQFDGLDDDLFDYALSRYGAAPRQTNAQRVTDGYLSHENDQRAPNPEAPVAVYHLGIRWRNRAEPATSERRGAYRPHLRTYLRYAQQHRPALFASMSASELWAGFIHWAAKNRPNIPLPTEKRAAVRVTEAIRNELAREQHQTGDQNANKPTQDQLRPSKRR